MAVQLTLTDISSGYQGTDIQANFTAIEDEFDKVLYRNGDLTVTGTMDMNSQRLVNLPAPTASHEPARKAELGSYVADAEAAQTAAETAQTAAETAQTAAETAETNAEAHYNAFQGVYYGSDTSDPAVDPNVQAPDTGDLYFNSTAGELRVHDGSDWLTAAPAAESVNKNLGGSFAVSSTIRCYRIGDQVTVQSLDDYTHTAGISANSASGDIPANMRPAETYTKTEWTATGVERISVDTLGRVNVFHYNYDGTTRSTSTMSKFAITYLV